LSKRVVRAELRLIVQIREGQMKTFVAPRRLVLRAWTAIAGACFLSAYALAAGVEVEGYGGGMTLAQGLGSHPMAGSQAGIRLGKRLTLLGEFGYTPLLSNTQQVSASGETATGSATLKMLTYGGAVDFSFASQSRLRPYAVFAVGGEHMWASATGSAPGAPTVNLSLGLGNGVYLGVGGGVRLYVGKRWGFKPEVRYMPIYMSVLGSSSYVNTVSYTGAFFFEIGGDK
jgi:hypothetical protein